MTTRAVPNPKRPYDDLRVIKDGSGNIISDRRNETSYSKITYPSSYQQQPQQTPSRVPKPFRHVKVIGRKPK